MTWIRRRRERKTARRAARMMLALDEAASVRTKPRPVVHASFGAR